MNPPKKPRVLFSLIPLLLLLLFITITTNITNKVIITITTMPVKCSSTKYGHTSIWKGQTRNQYRLDIVTLVVNTATITPVVQ